MDHNLSGEDVKHIVETLEYGSSEDVAELIFGKELLTERELTIPLQILSKLHNPTSESAISVLEAGYQRPFWMLILRVPWLNDDRAGPHYPLLLAHRDERPRIAGNVMPWNEISSMFTEAEHNNGTRLVVWWANWIEKYQDSK